MDKKLNEYKTEVKDLLMKLRTIQWTSEVDGTTVSHNVELFPSEKTELVTDMFLGYHGNRLCDCMFMNYVKGAMTATDFASVLKIKLTDRWKHMLGIKLAEYNPIWNVDGTEVHTITTNYGKVTVNVNGDVNETTHGDDTVEVSYGRNKTTEQLVDGHNNTTHGESIGTTHGESIGTTHNTTLTDTQTVAGSDALSRTAFNGGMVADTSRAINDGASTHATTGTDTEAHTGTDTETHSGTDQTTTSMGKIKDSDGGSDSTTTQYGKVTTTDKGENLEANTGVDVVTDKLVRGGNIGVTMTQQLLTAENDFWSSFDFFENWFKDIAKELSLPFYG